MQVTFKQEYLRELYEKGRSSNKKYRFQPAIIRKYGRVVNLMISEDNVLGLMKYGSLHYEHLHGDKEGLSSVRVNDQYRIEFEEFVKDGETVASICEITELSNHYK
ncbi:MAG: type II toxin-antitoxin system RelE/ParE family toxin [Prevotella sp.]|uniref:type II toxin-antitoxin system RelE/ParE family toxin n=1 Tax=Prevotella sp. AGR2160 TaxID=1280674 RepID=UPI0004922203|nr:type II toxin-antitoxin system RelE/ParE family toxin [Prevotella sp. AGR2160]MDD5861814.1 type II toxin-antitoxin system RelE/ParE family toxin [Prevotella sp.]